MAEITTRELLDLRNQVLAGTADDTVRARFAAFAGRLEHVPSASMLRSLLEDDDEIVRYNALNSLVLNLGQRSPEMAATCRRLVDEDPDEDVRRLALACLGSIYFGSHDIELFAWIRRRLAEERFELDLVGTAYQVLFEIPGRHAREWPDRLGRRDLLTYDEIDWDVVAELEEEVRTSGSG